VAEERKKIFGGESQRTVSGGRRAREREMKGIGNNPDFSNPPGFYSSFHGPTSVSSGNRRGSGKSGSGGGGGSLSQFKSLLVVLIAWIAVVKVPGVKSEIGGVIRVPLVLDRTSSPYYIREDVIIDHLGELIIKPGVQLLFSPTVGITVFGRIIAEVSVFFIDGCKCTL